MTRILFTICGRAGSKGIKNKNIKDFLGYPLPFYTVAAIDLYAKRNVDKCCDIVLNTDSQDLIDLFRKNMDLNFEVINRASNLAQDNTPKIEVVKNSMNEITQRKQCQYDMVIDLDITSPLRTVNDIERLVEKKRFNKSDVTFSVTTARRNPYFNMVKKTSDGFERIIKSDFNARQEAPEVFDMNASMYAFSPSFLLSNKSLFEGRCDAIEMQDTAVLDLDHETDFELMEIIADYLYKKDKAFCEIRDHIQIIIKK